MDKQSPRDLAQQPDASNAALEQSWQWARRKGWRPARNNGGSGRGNISRNFLDGRWAELYYYRVNNKSLRSIFLEQGMIAGPRVVDVAEQILADIRRRGLQPGDAYLGTAETTQWLRMNGSTVNRALQLLAQRGVIERRQRRGTIVRDPASRRSAGGLKRVPI